MGAYAIARYRAGGTATRFGMLAAQVLPPAVLVFPFLTMAYALRLNDTLVPVIFAHLSFVLPVVTWFLIGFFEAVPRSLEEQAQVDGFTRLQAFRLVVLPQVLPGIGAAAIFGFTLSWNDLFYGLILAPGKAAILPVAIAGFNTFRGVADRLDERGDPDRGRPRRHRELLHPAPAGAGHQRRRGEVLRGAHTHGSRPTSPSVNKSYGDVRASATWTWSCPTGRSPCWSARRAAASRRRCACWPASRSVTGGTITHRRPRRHRTCSPRDRDIAMVFQNYALYPHLTRAREHRLPAAGRPRAPRPRRLTRADEVAESLGLATLLAPQAQGALSGGQQQRVAIGRAIIREAVGVPVRRTAEQPRRQAARRDPHRDCCRSSAGSASPSCTSPTTRRRR